MEKRKEPTQFRQFLRFQIHLDLAPARDFASERDLTESLALITPAIRTAFAPRLAASNGTRITV